MDASLDKGFKSFNFWRKRGKFFTVEIVHHEEIVLEHEHCWFVYVYIFKGHKLWEQANKNTSDYDIILGDKLCSEFDGGCTYYHKNSEYVKIGCDYRHIWNEYEIRSEEMPSSVLDCATRVFDFFNKEMNNDNTAEL